LETAINESVLVLARSGYSTIMDLDRLYAKAFFIPTPGQFEQEYLAEFLEHRSIAPFATQNKFKIGMLEKSKNYKGFIKAKTSKTVEHVFDVFSK
jgi:UDP-N-acetylglucosamine:LPS N-acetylglucosamine transferase